MFSWCHTGVYQNIPTILFPAFCLSQWTNVSRKTHSRALSRRRRRKTRRRRRCWWFLIREHEMFTGNLNVRNPHLRLKLGLIKLGNWNDTKWLKKVQSQWWGDKMRRDKWIHLPILNLEMPILQSNACNRRSYCFRLITKLALSSFHGQQHIWQSWGRGPMPSAGFHTV